MRPQARKSAQSSGVLADPRRYVGDGEVRQPDFGAEFVPGERHRHPGAWACAGAVGHDGDVVAAIAQQSSRMRPVLLGDRRSVVVGVGGGHRPGHPGGEALDLGPAGCVGRLQRRDEVQALAAGGLDEASSMSGLASRVKSRRPFFSPRTGSPRGPRRSPRRCRTGPSGISPSKSAWSSGWSSTCTASRLSPGTGLWRPVTAQLASASPISSAVVVQPRAAASHTGAPWPRRSVPPALRWRGSPFLSRAPRQPALRREAARLAGALALALAAALLRSASIRSIGLAASCGFGLGIALPSDLAFTSAASASS